MLFNFKIILRIFSNLSIFLAGLLIRFLFTYSLHFDSDSTVEFTDSTSDSEKTLSEKISNLPWGLILCYNCRNYIKICILFL